jgi:hypothetical protein
MSKAPVQSFGQPVVSHLIGEFISQPVIPSSSTPMAILVRVELFTTDLIAIKWDYWSGV